LLQSDIFPLVRIDGEDLSLNQTSIFYTNMTDFLCKNYESDLCKKELEEINEDEK